MTQLTGHQFYEQQNQVQPFMRGGGLLVDGGATGQTSPTTQQSTSSTTRAPTLTATNSNTVGLYPAAQQWFNSEIPNYFPGSTVAGFNPWQTQGFAALNAQSNNIAKQGKSFMDLFNSRLQSGEGMNPYLGKVTDNYAALMSKNYAERLNPAMRGSQIAGGNVGGSAAGIAQGLAMQDLNREISDTTSQMYMQDWQQAMAQVPQMQQMFQTSQMLPGQTHLQTGAMQQAQAQAQLDAEINRWNYYRDAPENRLRAYSNLLSGAGNYSTQTANRTTTGGTPSMNWANIAGGGLMFASPYLSQWAQGGGGVTPASGGGGLLGI